MKTITAVCLILIVAGFGFGFQDTANWIRYESPQGRYAVRVPAQPGLSEQDARSKDGDPLKQYMATVDGADVSYMICYFDYTANQIFSLDSVRDAVFDARSGKLISENAISLGGYSGRELRFTTKDGNGAEISMQARIYDVDRRIYIVMMMFAGTQASESINSRGAAYFNSFEFKK